MFSECSVGTYSEGLDNEPCVVCPPNSEATQTGLTECTCVQDYYRATDEGPSANCTRECSTSNLYCSKIIIFLLTVIDLHYTLAYNYYASTNISQVCYSNYYGPKCNNIIITY